MHSQPAFIRQIKLMMRRDKDTVVYVFNDRIIKLWAWSDPIKHSIKSGCRTTGILLAIGLSASALAQFGMLHESTSKVYPNRTFPTFNLSTHEILQAENELKEIFASGFSGSTAPEDVDEFLCLLRITTEHRSAASMHKFNVETRISYGEKIPEEDLRALEFAEAIINIPVPVFKFSSTFLQSLLMYAPQSKTFHLIDDFRAIRELRDWPQLDIQQFDPVLNAWSTCPLPLQSWVHLLSVLSRGASQNLVQHYAPRLAPLIADAFLMNLHENNGPSELSYPLRRTAPELSSDIARHIIKKIYHQHLPLGIKASGLDDPMESARVAAFLEDWGIVARTLDLELESYDQSEILNIYRVALAFTYLQTKKVDELQTVRMENLFFKTTNQWNLRRQPGSLYEYEMHFYAIVLKGLESFGTVQGPLLDAYFKALLDSNGRIPVVGVLGLAIESLRVRNDEENLARFILANRADQREVVDYLAKQRMAWPKLTLEDRVNDSILMREIFGEIKLNTAELAQEAARWLELESATALAPTIQMFFERNSSQLSVLGAFQNAQPPSRISPQGLAAFFNQSTFQEFESLFQTKDVSTKLIWISNLTVAYRHLNAQAKGHLWQLMFDLYLLEDPRLTETTAQLLASFKSDREFLESEGAEPYFRDSIAAELKELAEYDATQAEALRKKLSSTTGISRLELELSVLHNVLLHVLKDN